MKYIKKTLQIWYAELMLLLHNQGLVIFCLLVPLAYPLLYAFVYTNETVREVPIVVVDECHSQQSREFSRKVDACSEVTVMYHTDLMQAQELLRQEKAYAIMRIPSSFSQDLAEGRQTYVALYSDMRCMLYYKAALLAASNVSLEMNNDIKVTRYLRGSTDQQEAVLRQPVTNSYVALYNPQSGVASFLIPAVMMLMIQQLLCLTIGTSMGIIREKNRGIGIPLGNPVYNNPVSIIAGKVLLYWPIFMLIGVYMFAGVTSLFQMPQLGDYVTFLRFMVPYVLACILMSFTFSTFIHRAEDSMLLFIFMSVPLLFVSGMSWPVASEPTFWRYVSYIFPSTFGMHGYVRIQNMGADLQDVGFEYRGLWMQCIVYFLLSLWVYRAELVRVVRWNKQEED